MSLCTFFFLQAGIPPAGSGPSSGWGKDPINHPARIVVLADHRGVFSVECVLYRMCSEYINMPARIVVLADHRGVFSIECVLYRMCSL